MLWRCPKCDDFKFSSDAKDQKCNCKSFNVVDEDGEEHEVYALYEEAAALKYAEESNVEGDYYLMNDSVDIIVDGNAYRISAEPDVHYSANKL